MRAALLALVLAALSAAPAAAAPTLVQVGRFERPVHVASPPGDARLFVAEKGGLVQIAGGGTFLDVRSITDSAAEERGLLSIAFAPDYATSGLLYVFLTSNEGGALRVYEFRRSADPNRADDASRRQILSIPHSSAANHNGGQLHFGPDGMLYVSTGDGGDTPATAQDLGSELGKILRIQPRTGAAAPGNPFGSRVWAYGLRNPWRFTFDRATGAMFIGDVGEGAVEELDRGARGANYGWQCLEGTRETGSCAAPANAIAPIVQHGHDAGWIAIVAGYVVRDPGLPTLAGRLIYGDNLRAPLRSVLPSGAGGRDEPLRVPGLASFGEDGCGRIHAVSLAGPVYRIQDGTATPCAGSGAPAPAPPTRGDTTPPRVAVSIRGTKTLARTRRLRIRIRCSERCRATVSSRLRKVKRLPTRRRTLAANRRAVVQIKLGRRATKALRRALRRRGAVRLVVGVRATDAAGNPRRVTRRARIRSRR